MVHRIYVEKKEGFNHEAEALKGDIASSLGIRLDGLRLINRYDTDNIDEELFERAVDEVFSEKAVDTAFTELPEAQHVFAVSPLPGQFDLRSHSAAECITFLSPASQPRVKASRIYLIEGATAEEVERIKKYVINPVEAMEDSLEEVDSLEMAYSQPSEVATLTGFRDLDDDGINSMIATLGLAMDADDLKCLQSYFREEDRDPTITEVRVCDTYWSDHCRHTTFLTELESVTFDDPDAEAMWQRYLEIRKELGRTKPTTLMDVATIGARHLKAKGLLPNLDESEEINACSIRIKCNYVDGSSAEHLLMFKNETHNHPTEIEPFGGAATCIGGAIRDPLSGRAYVHQAMRITGSGNVLTPFDETLPGKLPQKKIGVTAAQGYSSYGNQIGLATGLVDEIYHPGYTAKHMELGAVVASVKADAVRRERPAEGDVVILVGGRTGRDGIGGATGSSKSHKSTSLDTAGAEVQKGNAPEERKLQRLFRNPKVASLIKRCNDFGAGGVSVAIGELADGLRIDLDRVPKKYQGLDGTELAISESQERMAVVVEASDAATFLEEAEKENLEATIVATVTAEPVLRMDWQGRTIVSLKRSFLDTNGAPKKTGAHVASPRTQVSEECDTKEALSSLRFASRQGLSERFDSTIGAGTVLMPFGGKNQKTPEQVMCALLPDEKKRTTTASLFSYAFDPELEDADPFRGAYQAVAASVAKLVAAGSSRKGAYLTLQEYFGRTGTDPVRWGRPLAALLGALKAQEDLSVAAIGGKDSMSGTFEDIDVPNTLVSFAINTIERSDVISSDIKKAGSNIYLITSTDGEDIADYLDRVEGIIKESGALSASLIEGGRADVTLAKMCFGSHIGFQAADVMPTQVEGLSFIVETEAEIEDAIFLGKTNSSDTFNSWSLDELIEAWESTLEPVYLSKCPQEGSTCSITSDKVCIKKHGPVSIARPKVLIPVFPGTNCEVDSALAWSDAGAEAKVFVINNLSGAHLAQSISDFAAELSTSQILFIPGGFSGGDEPDGSGKFITAFMKSPAVKDALEELLNSREGLVGGICNGFQALVKLGLLPYGEFRTMADDSPTLTFNRIGRHQSRLVTTRVTSLLSPWLMEYELGQLQMVPISHGEGRFVASGEELERLIANGQVCTQYTTPDGLASMDIQYNPNGSALSIEGICSPDGRVFGRMGHVERCQLGLYRNVEESTSLPFFSGAVKYFK